MKNASFNYSILIFLIISFLIFLSLFYSDIRPTSKAKIQQRNVYSFEISDLHLQYIDNNTLISLVVIPIYGNIPIVPMYLTLKKDYKNVVCKVPLFSFNDYELKHVKVEVTLFPYNISFTNTNISRTEILSGEVADMEITINGTCFTNISSLFSNSSSLLISLESGYFSTECHLKCEIDPYTHILSCWC